MSTKNLCKHIYVVFLLLSLSFSSVSFAEIENYQEEMIQEEISQSSSQKEVIKKQESQQVLPRKKTSVWKYARRIISAPFVLISRYPRSEDTDMHQMYLEYVNKDTGRRWKKKEFKLKKEPPVSTNADQGEHVQEKNNQEVAS